MKTLLKSLCIFVTVLFISNVSTAQDNSSFKQENKDHQQTLHKAPVTNQNSIPLLSNCPPREDRLTCLKEPFDSAGVGWIIVPFDGALPPAYRNDDLSTVKLALGFTFNLYGSLYDSVYINTNGNITFDGPLSTFTPFAFPSSPLAIVAPFFADVDTRNLASGIVYYKLEATRLTIVWDSTGYYNSHVDLRNTFELIISDGTDPVVGIGNNICFSYGDMAWTTGDASLGIGGFGPPSTAATVGVNKGDGTTFATLGRFCRPGSYYGGPAIDTNGVSYLDCQNFCLDASNSGNICPVPSGFPGGPVVVTPGSPYNAVYSMSAPETSQITTGGVSGVPPNMTVTVGNGLTATFDVHYDPTCGDSGRHVVCFTGIDNATDPCTTTVCVIFEVDCPLPVEMSSFTSSITGRNVSLDWSTAMEVNNSRFEIERSSANDWQQVGTVNGNGTTTSPTNYSFVDRGLMSGTYHYRLKQIDFNGNFAYHNLSNEVVIGVPTTFELSQNYPNPFNPSTKIDYSIPFDGKVSLTIFDAMGREITRLVNNYQPAGYYSVNFNASSFASGIYYYRIEVSGTNNFVDSKKMLLVK